MVAPKLTNSSITNFLTPELQLQLMQSVPAAKISVQFRSIGLILGFFLAWKNNNLTNAEYPQDIFNTVHVAELIGQMERI